MYTNCLGNQVLMRASENSDLKSADFPTKKTAYTKSPYSLTSQVSGLDDWTTATILDRQRTLAELAVVAWPL